METIEETDKKQHIREYIERKLQVEFNEPGYIARTLEGKIDRKPCILLCCFPFAIICLPCICFYNKQKAKRKQEEEQKKIDANNKNFELRKTKEYQIEFIEKEIKNYKSRINEMKQQIPNTIYKIELLEEKLMQLNDN